MTRIEGVKVKVTRIGIMILLEEIGGNRRWRVTKQFGLEELPAEEEEK